MGTKVFTGRLYEDLIGNLMSNSDGPRVMLDVVRGPIVTSLYSSSLDIHGEAYSTRLRNRCGELKRHSESLIMKGKRKHMGTKGLCKKTFIEFADMHEEYW
jgi:hypothetical protein